MGQQVLVDNRPSAGGVVASEAVAKAEPDGYTLLFITNGNAVSASLFKSLPYDAVGDFAPVSTVGFFDLVLVVNSDSKIGSVRDLMAFARANPNKLNIGTINIGSTQNLAAELFKSMSGHRRAGRSVQGHARGDHRAEGRRRAGRVRDTRPGAGADQGRGS